VEGAPRFRDAAPSSVPPLGAAFLVAVFFAEVFSLGAAFLAVVAFLTAADFLVGAVFFGAAAFLAGAAFMAGASAFSGNVRSSVCGSKPLGPLRISGSHAPSDGSSLIAWEEAPYLYATTQHSSSVADGPPRRWQPTNVSIPDLQARWECTGAA
jgi:hypothetical protein